MSNFPGLGEISTTQGKLFSIQVKSPNLKGNSLIIRGIYPLSRGFYLDVSEILLVQGNFPTTRENVPCTSKISTVYY